LGGYETTNVDPNERRSNFSATPDLAEPDIAKGRRTAKHMVDALR
jgi:hypothetical protein